MTPFMHHNERNSPNAPWSPFSFLSNFSTPVPRPEVPLPFSRNTVHLSIYLKTLMRKNVPRGPVRPCRPPPTSSQPRSGSQNIVRPQKGGVLHQRCFLPSAPRCDKQKGMQIQRGEVETE